MFETMKIVHMLALMGGGAAAMGNGVLITKVLASGGPPSAPAAETMRILGMTGLVSIILLWITGLGMSFGFGVVAGGGAYWLKLLAAAVVLGGVSAMSMTAARARSAGQPPNLQKIKLIGRVSSVFVVLAVILAVVAFN